MTASPAPASQKTEKGTEYLCLIQSDVDGSWIEGKRIRAANDKAALRMAAEENGVNAEYVAVPTRSWKPVKVTVETTKTVKLG